MIRVRIAQLINRAVSVDFHGCLCPKRKEPASLSTYGYAFLDINGVPEVDVSVVLGDDETTPVPSAMVMEACLA